MRAFNLSKSNLTSLWVRVALLAAVAATPACFRAGSASLDTSTLIGAPVDGGDGGLAPGGGEGDGGSDPTGEGEGNDDGAGGGDDGAGGNDGSGGDGPGGDDGPGPNDGPGRGNHNAPVPEPATLALLGGGLAALAVARRRNKSRRKVN